MLKRFFKNAVQFILKWLAKIYLWRSKPYIIVVVGTTGRFWIKEAIARLLTENKLPARTNKKNFNAEIGLPLSILDLPSGEGSFKGWFKIIRQGFKKAISHQSLVINYLVLEIAIDRPRNMDYLLSIVKPKVAVFTAITPVYIENFQHLDKIALEYQKLIKVLPKTGLAILNADDERIINLKNSAACPCLTYGIDNKKADLFANNIKRTTTGQLFQLTNQIIAPSPQGFLPFFQTKEKTRQPAISVQINRFGRHHIYAELAKKAVQTSVLSKLLT